MAEAPQPMTRVERRRAERANQAAATEEIPSVGSRKKSKQSSRTSIGMVGRLSLLGVLAAATVVAPLSANLNTAIANASTTSTPASTTTASATPQAATDTESATLLGTEYGVGTDTSDPELSNVADAATRSRIRAAYESATATCADVTASAASGDVTAFNESPEVYYPMLQGTYTVSSVYGWRLNPVLGYMKLHAGQDFAAPVGTPIYAAAAGTVVEAGMVSGTGTITIKHEINGKVWYTRYLHMYSSGIYVTVGQQVAAGELIAGVGNTGNSTGPHLHFEVRNSDSLADSSSVDPVQWLKDQDAQQLSDSCS